MKRWMGVGLYVAAVAVFLEVVFRLAFSSWTVFHLVKGWDDSSGRIDWVMTHQETAPLVYTFDQYDMSRGWALVPNLKQMSIFGTKVLNSNSHGLRGSVEYSYSRAVPHQRPRLLIFGDSYTFGDEVSDEETYSHFLSQLLSEAEVLNMGVHGYGHDQMLVYLKEYGLRYQPDVVVLGYVALDRYRNLFAFNNYAKPRFEVTDSGIRRENPRIPSPEELLGGEVFRSKIFDAGVMMREKIRWATGRNDVRANQQTSAILSEFAATVREVGAAPLFVYLPVLKELDNLNEEQTEQERFLAKQCDTLDVPCLFLRPAFIEAAKAGATFNTQSHWLATEHRIAAEAIASFLRIMQARSPLAPPSPSHRSAPQTHPRP